MFSVIWSRSGIARNVPSSFSPFHSSHAKREPPAPTLPDQLDLFHAYLRDSDALPSVDTHFLVTLTEEVGVGASAVLGHDIASLISIDNGTTAPGQNSRETGVTIGMADMTGPFDWHVCNKLVKLCREHAIPFQRDVFRYYRSDSAAALVAGADVRTGLIAFGIDASHGYERIHEDALHALAQLVVAYTLSPVEIPRDAEDLGDMAGFTDQPLDVVETPRPMRRKRTRE